MIEAVLALALLLVAAFAFGYHTGVDAANARRDLSDAREVIRARRALLLHLRQRACDHDAV